MSVVYTASVSDSKPKVLWNLRHWIPRFEREVNPNLCYRAAETDVHAIFDIVVEDLTLKLLVIIAIVAKPLAGKFLEGSHLWPKALVEIRSSFATRIHMALVALVGCHDRKKSFIHVKETMIRG